jgi:peroxiredoxin
MRRFALVCLSVAAMLCLVSAAAFSQSPPPAPGAAGEAPPPPPYLSKEVPKLDGSGKVILQSLLKKEKTALVFFQSACSACRGEMAFLNATYGKNDKVDLVGVSVDFEPGPAARFVQQTGFSGLVLNDPEMQFASMFGVSYTPVVLVLDKKGAVAGRVNGYSDKSKDELANILK